MKIQVSDSFLSWIVAIVFLLPLSISGGGVSGKPIDFVLSDLVLVGFYLFSIFGLLVRGSAAFPDGLVTYIASFIVMYCAVLAIFGVMFSGDVLPIFSMFKFIKPFFFIGMGWWWAKAFGYNGVCRMAYVAGFVLVGIFFSDLVYGDFPHGCGVEGRWGGCVGGYEVYGFPNSAASFIVILLVFVLSAYFARLRGQLFFISTAFLAVILGVLSLSRAAWIFIAWVFLIWILLDGYRMLVAPSRSIGIVFLVFFLVGISLLFLMGGDLIAGVLNKFSFSMERSDVTSGRADIWMRALDLISQKPLFGYYFESFSRYMPGFDTPHNQYLEWLYKIGFVGLVLLFVLFLLAVASVVQVYQSTPVYSRQAIAMLSFGGFFGVLINGLFQPIISFSLVGNLLMLCIGAVAYFAKSRWIEREGVIR
ncbi:O-antigen ligase [Pseudomonas sp.]|uniref:O-antigen ligase family protein n=1 Tax=Pseudomonas sp. TaxID=306 RepID=UPI002734BCBC|nr:O-antigen ligase family protein [Pseudomonas sp.]MDP3816905.1 O-antigen ligase family protein [Pseudomonas sp.]